MFLTGTQKLHIVKVHIQKTQCLTDIHVFSNGKIV